MTHAHKLSEISKIIPEFTDDIIPLQYIGITDIDGIELCEGDIVRIKGGAEYQGMREIDKVGVITYSSASFDVVTKDKVYYSFGYCDIDSIDILGNIYETPEIWEKF